MGCSNDSGRTPPRKRLHLSLPDNFDHGDLREAAARIRPDHDLQAVVVELADIDVELVLFPDSAVNFVLAMVGAISQLRGYGTP